VKRIILCFDGTGNEPGDVEEKKSEAIANDNSISNILKIHLLSGGNIDNEVNIKKFEKNALVFNNQISLYYPGVGVRGNFFKRLWRQAFASKGPKVIMDEAFNDLKEIYEKNDILYIFGFSRGAAIARMFASIIAKKGIQTKSNENDNSPTVEFLGAFDTVAAFGMPNLDSHDRPVSDVIFENRRISPIIKNATHLVSLDENRKAFKPTLMNYQSNISEIWFPGVHSDVGGGYFNDGISDIALEYMIKQSKLYGLKFFNVEDIPEKNLVGKDHNDKEIRIDKDYLNIKPDCNAIIHDHNEKWRLAKTLSPRNADVLKNDIPCDIKIKVHQSVIDRKNSLEYNPKPLDHIIYDVVS